MNKLYVVGIGPGEHESLSLKADRVLKSCDTIIGYHVYVDLLRDYYPDKTFISSQMTQEKIRCQKALDLASEGKVVALVCSGDSGVYGMASLTYELRGEAEDPAIEVVPGLTAALSGAALLGAPLTHDFAVISLSDRLTPWESIEKRLALACDADLSIVLYNPASRSRADHLMKACDILLEHLPKDRLCGVARNIGREGEEIELMSLSELRHFKADMFCTVFIGNASVKKITGKMVTPRGYRDV